MSTLTRAKAAFMLAALLVTTGLGSAALAAPGQAGSQQALGIVALRHDADGVQTRIYLEGTAELPYTIYRPDERTILVDLPGADASKLEEAYPVDSRGVERIQVERLRTASGQSLARLRIRLKAPVEDRTVVDGKNLVVTLTAASSAPAPAAAPAPAPAREAAASMRSEVPAAKPEAVSPLQPLTTAAIPTAPATTISNVRTDVQNGTFRAFVATDGRASFKHFVLPNPDRIVVDITGVTSKVERNAMDVAGGGISRIRIGQFRTSEPRVVRIVFDVAKMGPYDVRQVGNDVVVSLGPGAGEVASAPAKSPKPAAETRRPEPVAAAPTPKPAPAPIVGDDDNPAAVKSATKPATKPVSRPAAPAAKPEAVKDPARNPAVMSPAATPSEPVVQPIVDEGDDQRATGRPAPPPPRPSAAAPTARPQSTQATQAPPPSPAIPRQTSGAGTYLSDGFVGKPVNLELKNVDLRDLLRFLHNKFGVNFIVDRSVPGSVPIDVSVKDIPWNQALDAVLRSQGLGVVREIGGIVRVSTLGSIAQERDAQRAVEESYFNTLPLTTKIFRLKYASPANDSGSGSQARSARGGGGGGSVDPTSARTGILAFIRNRLSTRGRVEFDTASNSVIVTDLQQRLAVIEEIIRTLDRPQPQVEIEARIVVARRTFMRDLGVQLSGAVANTGRNGLFGFSSNGGLPPVPGTPTTPEIAVPDTGSIFTLTTGAIGTFQINATLIASEQKGQIRTIAAPRVTTQNNTQATITNGVQIPVQTVTNNTVTTTFVDAALQLVITPQIIAEDGAVLLSVSANNNNVSTLRTVGGTPGIDTQSADAIVLVPDGGTTVFGGINVDTEDQEESRTPGLARIPIFGNLFKRRSSTRNTSEILFFITPRIFRPELVGLPQETNQRTNDVTILPMIPAGSEGGTSVVAAPAGVPGGPSIQ